MSTPMWDIPDHLMIPVSEDGRGPVPESDAHHWACWCGDDACLGAGQEPSTDCEDICMDRCQGPCGVLPEEPTP